MIKIIKDIEVFGIKILEGGEVTAPPDITNSGAGIIVVTLKNKNAEVGIPIICESYNKTTIQFLDEICRLNTGHESYYAYLDDKNMKESQMQNMQSDHAVIQSKGVFNIVQIVTPERFKVIFDGRDKLGNAIFRKPKVGDNIDESDGGFIIFIGTYSECWDKIKTITEP